MARKNLIMGNGVVTHLSHDGRGIAHVEGKTTFISGALVGEEVEFVYSKRKSRFDEAQVTRILCASEEREIPKCDFFTICGGCSLQHMNSNLQIIHKQTVLLEQLQHMGGVAPLEILPPLTASPWGYRRKARLGVRYVIKKEKLLIGFREKNSRYLAEIESCATLHPSIGEKIPLLRDFVLSLEAYLTIPQLEIVVGDDETAIIIRHLSALTLADQQRINEFAQKNAYHIYLQPGGQETVHLVYPQNVRQRLRYLLSDYNLEMWYHPSDFIQVHKEINIKLIKVVLELLEPKSDEVFLDLFCGAGNFTLPLARFSKKVIGIEGSVSMVERGIENAQHNHMSNVEFLCQNLQDPNYDASWVNQTFAGILLDPPRTGAWEIAQVLPSLKARRIVYVSCNPATMARDVGYLCKHGYQLKKIGVLDMFAHTGHVESVALLERTSRA